MKHFRFKASKPAHFFIYETDAKDVDEAIHHLELQYPLFEVFYNHYLASFDYTLQSRTNDMWYLLTVEITTNEAF